MRRARSFVTEGKTLPVHLGDVITAYTGKMYTPDRSVKSLRTMLQFMVNRRLLVPQLIRAADVVRPTLAQHFSWLTTLTLPVFAGLSAGERDTVAQQWLDELAGEHGAMLRVPQLPEGLWIDMDPIAEMRYMMRPDTELQVAVECEDGRATHVIDPPRGMFRNPPLFDPD